LGTADLRNRVCLFVCSSDRTADVFEQVSPSFAVWWSACPFVKFVGLNSATTPAPGFVPVSATVKGWREELLPQIEQLPERYDYVLLFLDDFFLLSPVDQGRLELLLAHAIGRRLDYLRLVPIQRVMVARVLHALFCDASPVEPINPAMPYYSSLQLALWKRSHLMETLRVPVENIWEFEHRRIPGRVHCAVRGAPPIRYVHMVEKGKWQAYAPGLFRRIGMPFHQGDRGSHPRSTLVWIGFSRLRFAVIGYALLRVRRYLRNAKVRSEGGVGP